MPGARWLALALRLVCLFAVLGAGAARASSIRNTASASWRAGGIAYNTQSNTVVFDVAQTVATIETFRAAATGTELDVRPLACGSGSTSGGAGQTSVEQARSVTLGSEIVVRIVAAGANRDPLAVDTATIAVTVSSGDRETYAIAETGPNTGVFTGAIRTQSPLGAVATTNCVVEARPDDMIDIAFRVAAGRPVAGRDAVRVISDPSGFVFDSEDGRPVDGVAVTLVDAATGSPASVFASDGTTSWPSRVMTGAIVRDGAGAQVRLGPGEYLFPHVSPGRYRLIVEPPDPWRAPSTASRAELAVLRRPDGEPLRVSAAGSWGQDFAVTAAGAVRLDIPLDSPVADMIVSKTVSRREAVPGDALGYRVVVTNADAGHARRSVVLVDRAAAGLRLSRNSVRIDGKPAGTALEPQADGSGFRLALGRIASGAQVAVTYMMTVRPDAVPGSIENRAVATDARGRSATGSVAVRITRDSVADRMTVIGAVLAGPCDSAPSQQGVAGVRVLLEDGSYALTDADGRFHFDGIVPGTHVVALVPSTLPDGAQILSCGTSTRRAGRPGSAFVMGQGGSLHRVNFYVSAPRDHPARAVQKAVVNEDVVAAGGDVDWLAAGDGPIDWLFPAPDHNPRAPAVRVVIRHRPGQKVELRADGRRVPDLAAEGARVAPGGTYAVSVWRGIPLEGDTTHLEAFVRDPSGTVVTHLLRDVHFNTRPARVEIVAARSRLVADGDHQPVLAVRVLDRHGRPVHAGIGGEVAISAPYEGAATADQSRARALLGLGQASPRWTVTGDDGLAYVALAPTMVSGPLRLEFAFGEGLIRRRQVVEGWVEPGDQKWTLVGLAQAGIGARSIADEMERADAFSSDLGSNARVAFYAKGRILGRSLLTVAYDSAKQRADQRLLGAIEPDAYYTVFADGSQLRHDAASRDRLYLRIESRAFYAAYGDFQTGFEQTRLARYQRAMTGFKGEARLGHAHVIGFAARSSTSHRHEELAGAGITGPYRLASRDIMAGSETVAIETRDRFRSDQVIDRQAMVRFLDYDLDVPSGTITFKEPVAGRDGALNARVIVVEYDTLGEGAGTPTGGLRADWTSAAQDVRAGMTVISEGQEGARTDLAGLDLRLRRGSALEVRAETAGTRSTGNGAGKDQFGWLLEAERHDGRLDLLAYAHAADAGFGLSQLDGAERGRRKIGVDGRYMVTDIWSITASGWTDRSLIDAGNRDAVQLRTDLRNGRSENHLSLARFDDTAADGSAARSTVIEAGSARRFLDGRLEVEAAAAVALGQAGSTDMPARQRFSARYMLRPGVRLVGLYEFGAGDALRTHTARGGIEATAWEGGRLAAALGQQDSTGAGNRTFAGFGLSQSVPVGHHLSLDGMVDANRVLRRQDPVVPIVDPYATTRQGALAEAYTAVSLAAAWHDSRWNASLRTEWRDGEQERRKGVSFAALRQLGEGRMLGTYLRWTAAENTAGTATRSIDAALSAAWRPESARLAVLTRLELRSDAVTGAIAGTQAPAGAGLMVVSGDGRSTRAIASVSTTWTPRERTGGTAAERSEVSVFAAVRHTFDSMDQFDLRGFSVLGGVDMHVGVAPRIEVGGSFTLRASPSDGTMRFALGPTIGFTPAPQTLVTVGYNLTGFRDRDFSAARSTNRGIFAAIRMKFDATDLGLGRR